MSLDLQRPSDFSNRQAPPAGMADQLGPPPAATNWSSPGSDSSSQWQNMTPDPASWASEIQTAPQSAFDSPSTQSGWGQNDAKGSSDGFDLIQQGLRSMNQNRPGNDSSRPYNGAWPSANSLPANSYQPNAAAGRTADGFDSNGSPFTPNGIQTQPAANQGAGNSNRLAPPQWPYAPNR
jgi:hypothetical protein